MKRKCSINGCERPHAAKGFCMMHYYRMRNNVKDMRPEPIPQAEYVQKSIEARRKNYGQPCMFPNCNNPYYAKDLCHTHYELQRRTGGLVYKKNKPKQRCSVNNCDNLASTKGFCRFHYIRKKTGVPLNRPKGNKGELNVHWRGGVARYPNHSEMKRARKEVLEQANYRCWFCGGPAVQIHHKDGTTHNHSKDNLISVCRKCHPRRKTNSTSKYKRLYGKTLNELADALNVSTTTILKYHHRDGNLSKLGFYYIGNKH